MWLVDAFRRKINDNEKLIKKVVDDFARWARRTKADRFRFEVVSTHWDTGVIALFSEYEEGDVISKDEFFELLRWLEESLRVYFVDWLKEDLQDILERERGYMSYRYDDEVDYDEFSEEIDRNHGYIDYYVSPGEIALNVTSRDTWGEGLEEEELVISPVK
jgi:hypothetical protein